MEYQGFAGGVAESSPDNAHVLARVWAVVRRAWWLLGLALVVAGCLSVADEVEPAPETVWHLSSDIEHEPGFCGDCHYGIEEFWLADWTQTEGNWTLSVRPKYAEAPLHALSIGDQGARGDWIVADVGPIEGSGMVKFEAPAGDWLIIKVFASGPQNDALDLSANRQDVRSIDVALHTPSGQRVVVEGPEDDLHIAVVPYEPGEWVIDVDGPREGLGSITYRWEIVNGTMVPTVAPGDEAIFTFPAGPDGAPPNTTLRLHPHHDHAEFQNSDWDAMDSHGYAVHFTPNLGPAPEPKAWNATEIEALWDGRAEYVFREWSGSMTAAYKDDYGHNDPGAGSDYPQFNSPDGIPVLPGTGMVRIDLTWEPATDEPDLLVKMSPANWPYFLEPEARDRGAGWATFDFPITPNWWEHPEQTLEWLEPGVVRSYYDIAPFIREDGELHVVNLDYTMTATAVRGV